MHNVDAQILWEGVRDKIDTKKKRFDILNLSYIYNLSNSEFYAREHETQLLEVDATMSRSTVMRYYTREIKIDKKVFDIFNLSII